MTPLVATRAFANARPERRAWRTRLRSERGAELVEFALTLPMLLLITLGIFDFGLLFQQYQVITNAAREGARMAALSGVYTCADVEARVTAYVTAGGLNVANLQTPIGCNQSVVLSFPSGANAQAATVTVQFLHPYSFVGGIAQLLGSSFGTTTLQAVATSRKEVGAGEP